MTAAAMVTPAPRVVRRAQSYKRIACAALFALSAAGQACAPAALSLRPDHTPPVGERGWYAATVLAEETRTWKPPGWESAMKQGKSLSGLVAEYELIRDGAFPDRMEVHFRIADIWTFGLVLDSPALVPGAVIEAIWTNGDSWEFSIQGTPVPAVGLLLQMDMIVPSGCEIFAVADEAQPGDTVPIDSDGLCRGWETCTEGISGGPMFEGHLTYKGVVPCRGTVCAWVQTVLRIVNLQAVQDLGPDVISAEVVTTTDEVRMAGRNTRPIEKMVISDNRSVERETIDGAPYDVEVLAHRVVFAHTVSRTSPRPSRGGRITE